MKKQDHQEINLRHKGINIMYHFARFNEYHFDVLIAFNREGISHQLYKQNIK